MRPPSKYRDKVVAEFERGNFDVADIARKTGAGRNYVYQLRIDFRKKRNLANQQQDRLEPQSVDSFTRAVVRGCFLQRWPLAKTARLAGLSSDRVFAMFQELEEAKFRDLYER